MFIIPTFSGELAVKNDKSRRKVEILEKQIEKLLYYLPPSSNDSDDDVDNMDDDDDDCDEDDDDNENDIDSPSPSQAGDSDNGDFADIENGLRLCTRRLRLMTELGFKARI